MSQHLSRRGFLALVVLAASASCRDVTAPSLSPTGPVRAQGDGGQWVVNSSADPGENGCDDTECTLREAIASAAPGDMITFASELSSILLNDGELTIDKDLSVNGNGLITIDAQGASRVLQVTGDIVVTLTGLSITNGDAGDDEGGGIVVSGAQLTLDGVTVADNSSSEEGGGIYVGSGTLVARRSTISSNDGESGGGISSRGSVTLRATTVSNNLGGALINAGTMLLVASTVSGHEAENGSIVFSNSALTLVSSAITHNASPRVLRAPEGTVVLANSIVTGLSGPGVQCDFEPNQLTPPPVLMSGGHNLLSPDCAAIALDATDQVIADALAYSQILEEELNDNGGPTKTHALFEGGLAVDAGDCPSQTSDQRGLARPVDIPDTPNATLAGCDIGPYELQLAPPAIADLMISQSADKIGVKQGDLLTYLIRVQNLGPATATNVVVNDFLASGVTFVEARASKETSIITAPPSGETGTVTWYVGDMAVEDNETVEIAVTVVVRGRTTVTNTATVTADDADSNEANNTTSLQVSVASGKGGSGGGGGGGGGGKGGGPKQ